MIATEKQAKKWYTVKVQNNRERTVTEKLKFEMMREFGEDTNFFIPSRTIMVIKNNKKTPKEEILYPGYIFVETEYIDRIVHLIKTTNGATSVIKDNSGRPAVLKQSEINRMLGEKEANKASLETTFIVGEKVKITSGSFMNFKGIINSIDLEKSKCKIEVLIFGRSTLVDLTLDDIDRDE